MQDKTDESEGIIEKVTETGYSMSTMKKIFCMARNEAEADMVAELMDRCKTEDEVLAAIAMMETKTAPDDDQE